MLRTIFAIGLFFFAGLLVLRIVFGVFGSLFGLIWWLLFLAVKIAVVGLVIDILLSIFSPSTARRMRDKWGGN